MLFLDLGMWTVEITSLLVKKLSEAKFKEFEPCCWTTNNRFQLSASSNLKTIIKIFSWTNNLWIASRRGSNPLNSDSDVITLGLGYKWRIATVDEFQEHKNSIFKHIQYKTVNVFRISNCPVSHNNKMSYY